MMGLCIAKVCMAALPAGSRTEFQRCATFLSAVCGIQEMHHKKGFNSSWWNYNGQSQLTSGVTRLFLLAVAVQLLVLHHQEVMAVAPNVKLCCQAQCTGFSFTQNNNSCFDDTWNRSFWSYSVLRDNHQNSLFVVVSFPKCQKSTIKMVLIGILKEFQGKVALLWLQVGTESQAFKR